MDKHLKFALTTAEQAGKKLMQYFGKTDLLARGTSKEFKTVYDDIADKLIIKEIEKKFPEYSYLTEESGFIDKNFDYVWIIDPLDGTGNFMNGNPLFAVSVALWRKGKPVVGVIEAPAIEEKYIATATGGAWMIERRGKSVNAKTTNLSELKQAYILYCEGGERDKKRVAGIFNYIYPKAKEVRKIGSAALELAWVGMGRAECYYTTKINLWDIAAGMLFVKEAGGKILQFSNEPYKWQDFKIGEQVDLLVTNGKVLPKIKY